MTSLFSKHFFLLLKNAKFKYHTVFNMFPKGRYNQKYSNWRLTIPEWPVSNRKLPAFCTSTWATFWFSSFYHCSVDSVRLSYPSENWVSLFGCQKHVKFRTSNTFFFRCHFFTYCLYTLGHSLNDGTNQMEPFKNNSRLRISKHSSTRRTAHISLPKRT